MANWQSETIPTNGIRIHYTRTGGNKPPIVLAHGFSDAGLCWTPVAEVLAETYDVIMTDARGHGRSDAPESGYGVTDMAADIAGVITGLGLEKPAMLGHSMGGATTFVLAGTYPDLLGAILVEDAGGINIASGNRPEAAERMAQARERMTNLQSLSRAEVIAHGHETNPAWSQAELEPWADAKLRFNLRALNRMGTSVENWEEVLRNIRCPALLITADVERGAIVDEAGATKLQAVIPQLTVAHVTDAGHNIRREQFAKYMEIVQTFLDEQRAI
ncbi:MAG: alpha/beta hydrolase [Caldilineaceae bacterium]|nr:alpha/beta hydrolase [Caldilineaceae bacterium]